MSLQDVLSAACLILGVFFSVTGAFGLFKLPDFFTRVHAASVTDSLATMLIIVGLLLQTETGLVAVKLLFILGFLLLTSPTASHALAKAARHGGMLTMPENKDKQQQDQHHE